MKHRDTYTIAVMALVLVGALASYGQADNHEGHDHATHAQVQEESHEEEGHEGHGHDEHEEEESSGSMELDHEIMEDLNIQTAIAAEGELRSSVTLPGEIRVNQDRLTHIVPRYSGLVTEVRKRTGDHVEKGDVLAVLESNESLAPYELKALIDGTVIEKHITIGESLSDDAVVFTIADLNTVWAVLTVYQKHLDVIHPGDLVEVFSGQSRQEGAITYISPTLDEATRTAHARVVLPNKEGIWKPGMFVTGRAQLPHTKAPVVVPSSAVQVLEGEDVVFVREGDGFASRPVTIGRRTPEQVEIKEGLSPGMEYVSSGAFHLKAEIITSGLGAHAGHGH